MRVIQEVKVRWLSEQPVIVQQLLKKYVHDIVPVKSKDLQKG